MANQSKWAQRVSTNNQTSIQASKPDWSEDGQTFQVWMESHNYYSIESRKLVGKVIRGEISLAQAIHDTELQFGKNQ